MWLERFVIIPMSLSRDFLPSNWGYYSPTFWDWALFIGTMGLFTFLFFMFIKVLPMINIFEMRDLSAPHQSLRTRRTNGHNGHSTVDEDALQPVTALWRNRLRHRPRRERPSGGKAVTRQTEIGGTERNHGRTSSRAD